MRAAQESGSADARITVSNKTGATWFLTRSSIFNSFNRVWLLSFSLDADDKVLDEYDTSKETQKRGK